MMLLKCKVVVLFFVLIHFLSFPTYHKTIRSSKALLYNALFVNKASSHTETQITVKRS